MNPIADYIAEQTKVCREQWFKEHRAMRVVHNNAELHNEGACSVINWQNPKSWNYGCRFIIHRRWLCVVGDIGEATFEWSEDLTLEFLGSLDFGYFHSKCRASDSGRKFEQWNPREAWKALKQLEQEYKQDGIIKYTSQIGKGSGKDEYEFIAREFYNKTGEAELASMIASGGNVPSVHCIGMFVGLQMAIAQLKEKA